MLSHFAFNATVNSLLVEQHRSLILSCFSSYFSTQNTSFDFLRSQEVHEDNVLSLADLVVELVKAIVASTAPGTTCQCVTSLAFTIYGKGSLTSGRLAHARAKSPFCTEKMKIKNLREDAYLESSSCRFNMALNGVRFALNMLRRGACMPPCCKSCRLMTTFIFSYSF